MEDFIFGQQILATCLPQINLQEITPIDREYINDLQKKEIWNKEDFSFLLEVQKVILQGDREGTCLKPYYMNIENLFFENDYTIYYKDKEGKNKKFSPFYGTIWDKSAFPEIFLWLLNSVKKDNIFYFDYENLIEKVNKQKRNCNNSTQIVVSFFNDKTFLVEQVDFAQLFTSLYEDDTKSTFCNFLDSVFLKNNFNIFYEKFFSNCFFDIKEKKELLFSTIVGDKFFDFFEALPEEYREQFWLMMSYMEGEIQPIGSIIEICNDNNEEFMNYKDELFSRKFGNGLFSFKIEFNDKTAYYHNDNQFLTDISQEKFDLLMLKDEVENQDSKFTENEKQMFVQLANEYLFSMPIENTFIQQKKSKNVKIKSSEIKNIYFPTTTLILYCAFNNKKELLDKYIEKYGDKIVESQELTRIFNQYTEICLLMDRHREMDHVAELTKNEKRKQQVFEIEQIKEDTIAQFIEQETSVKKSGKKSKIKPS